MLDKDRAWDVSLHIKTTGRDDTSADQYHHPYEPTPYRVLERLINSELIGEDDVVLDYGCGKGRVDFFLSHRIKAKTIGIEYDKHNYQSAVDNQRNVQSRVMPQFVLIRVEVYEVPLDVNRCYFFNPFSVEILRKVLARIMESYYDSPRVMLLFFYYPSDEYIAYLMTVDELEFYYEIRCDDLFEGKDNRERIVIFRLPSEL